MQHFVTSSTFVKLAHHRLIEFINAILKQVNSMLKLRLRRLDNTNVYFTYFLYSTSFHVSCRDRERERCFAARAKNSPRSPNSFGLIWAIQPRLANLFSRTFRGNSQKIHSIKEFAFSATIKLFSGRFSESKRVRNSKDG